MVGVACLGLSFVVLWWALHRDWKKLKQERARRAEELKRMRL